MPTSRRRRVRASRPLPVLEGDLPEVPRGRPTPGSWRLARLLVLLGMAGEAAALVLAPAAGLRILWSLVVPLLPAVFLVSPVAWRNLCPLATLEMGLSGDTGRVLTAEGTHRAALAGIAAFGVVVPARLLLFDADAAATALLLAALAAGAAVRGRAFLRRAGFCHSLCPMLAVERLYGQAPLAAVHATRCPSCVPCTARGCLDLSPAKSIPQILGPSRRSLAWSRTPFGVFAAGFPGFVAAYGIARGAGHASPLGVYGTIAVGAAASYALTLAAAALTGADSRTVLRLLAASAISLFYWQTAPGVVGAWDLPASGTALLRLAAVALVALWLVRAHVAAPERSRARRRRRIPRRGPGPGGAPALRTPETA